MPEGMPDGGYSGGAGMNDIVDGLQAVAYAAKVSGVESAFGEKAFAAEKIINVQHSFSPMYAACGSTLAEKRSVALVQKASCEKVAVVSDMRVPAVIISVSASCSDVFYSKETDAIIFLPESRQEIIDSTILAYKICEDNRVLLPALIKVEDPGMREVVKVPTEQAVENILPKLRLPSKIDHKKPFSFNLPSGDSEHVIQKMKAMESSYDVMKKAFEKWGDKFKREQGFFESYRMEDAEYAFVCFGQASMAVRGAVDYLRGRNEKAGMVRVRVLKPFDVGISEVVKGKKVAVVDSCGLLGMKGDINLMASGKRVSEKDVTDVFAKLKKGESARLWI